MGTETSGNRLTAAERDEGRRCRFERPDSSQCGNYATTDGDAQRCRFHGGVTKEVVVVRQQTAVDKALGYPLEPVTVSDFPKVAAEYVAAFNLDFARLRVSLETLRAEGDLTEVDFVREYADLLGQQRATASKVVDLMTAAAKLGIASSSQQVADAVVSQSWLKIRGSILDALAPYPEARLAISEALAGRLTETGEAVLSRPETYPADAEPADRGSATEIEDGWDLI